MKVFLYILIMLWQCSFLFLFLFIIPTYGIQGYQHCHEVYFRCLDCTSHVLDITTHCHIPDCTQLLIVTDHYHYDIVSTSHCLSNCLTSIIWWVINTLHPASPWRQWPAHYPIQWCLPPAHLPWSLLGGTCWGGSHPLFQHHWGYIGLILSISTMPFCHCHATVPLAYQFLPSTLGSALTQFAISSSSCPWDCCIIA